MAFPAKTLVEITTGGLQATPASSLHGIGCSPWAVTCRPDQSRTCGRTGQQGAMACSRPSGIRFCWRPWGRRRRPQGHVPGFGQTGLRSHGRHLQVAGLAQSASASAMGQRATQRGGASGGSQIPQNGDLLLGWRCQLAALAPPETAMDREERSVGALRGSTPEDSGGALWRGPQEGAPPPPQTHSPGLSDPHRLQVSLRAWPHSTD